MYGEGYDIRCCRVFQIEGLCFSELVEGGFRDAVAGVAACIVYGGGVLGWIGRNEGCREWRKRGKENGTEM
jgi:hypothetical protein